MLGLEDIADPLQQDIQELKSTVRKLKHQKLENKIKGINQARETHAQLINLLKTLKDRVDLEEDQTQLEKYSQQIKQFHTALNEILQQLDYYQAEGRSEKQLFKGANKEGEDLDVDLQRLIQIGRTYQKDGIDALMRAEKYLEQAIEIADNVNLTLDQQIQQLDRIYNSIKDTDSTMDKAMKYINYFAKQVYTDKCLMVLIGLIIVAIIVVVILTAVGVGSGSTTPSDQLI